MITFGSYLAKKYTKKDLIDQNSTEIYAFLFDYIFSSVTYDLSLIFIGIILKKIVATLIFIFITSPIRIFAGGYHAHTRLQCNVLSYFVFFSYLYIASIKFPSSFIWQISCFIINWILILLISPVESENKQFTDKERTSLFHKLFIIFTFITFTQLLLRNIEEVFYINLCLIICTLSLYAGYSSNKS